MSTVLVTDLDGTIAFDGNPPIRELIDELNALAGLPDVRLIIATSRSPRSVQAWFGALADTIDLICCNGALVISAAVEAERHPIETGLLERMLHELRRGGEQHEPEQFCLEYGDRFVASSAAALPWMGAHRRSVLGHLEQPQLHGVLKLSVAHADPWGPRLHELAGDAAEVFPHTTGDADVVAAGITKASALQRLLSGAGTDGTEPTQHRVTAFGNDTNDLAMLQAAHRSVLVGDGLPGLERLGHVRRISGNSKVVLRTVRKECNAIRRASEQVFVD